jgi:hypothetical protein
MVNFSRTYIYRAYCHPCSQGLQWHEWQTECVREVIAHFRTRHGFSRPPLNKQEYHIQQVERSKTKFA